MQDTQAVREVPGLERWVGGSEHAAYLAAALLTELAGSETVGEGGEAANYCLVKSVDAS